MIRLKTIYKRSVLESRFGLSIALMVSIGTTLALLLLLAGYASHSYIALLGAALSGGFYYMFGKSGGITVKVREVAFFLLLNILILIYFALVK